MLWVKIVLVIANNLEFNAISPMLEMGAYEWLWSQSTSIKPSFKTLSKLFASSQARLFSVFVDPNDAESSAHQVLERFKKHKLESFSIQLEGTGDFPKALQVTHHIVF